MSYIVFKYLESVEFQLPETGTLILLAIRSVTLLFVWVCFQL